MQMKTRFKTCSTIGGVCLFVRYVLSSLSWVMCLPSWAPETWSVTFRIPREMIMTVIMIMMVIMMMMVMLRGIRNLTVAQEGGASRPYCNHRKHGSTENQSTFGSTKWVLEESIFERRRVFCIFGIMTNFVGCLYHNPSLICAPGVSCGGFGKFWDTLKLSKAP